MPKQIIANWLERYGAPQDVAEAGAALAEGLDEGRVRVRGPDLSASPLVATEVPGRLAGSASAPLVARAGTWQFQRYAQYERRLQDRLRHFAEGAPHLAGVDTAPQADTAPQEALLDTLFPERGRGGTEARQAEAARGALRAQLTVIAGGPGTGKTTTVVRLIALVQAARARAAPSHRDAPLRLGLLAPTGKAAARLAQAFRQGHAALPEALRPLTPAQAAAIEAQTIHRALGLGHQTGRPRFDGARALPFDLVIVDEASMVDLAVMTLLFEALANDAQVVLMGDPQQLAAVEPGAPFADLVTRLTREGGACFHLEHSFRFGARPGIGAIAEVLSRGDSAALAALLAAPPAGLSYLPELGEEVWQSLAGLACERDTGAEPATPPSEATALVAAFKGLDRVRALCVHRQGPLGTAGINHRVMRRLGHAARTPDAALPQATSLIPVIFTHNQSDIGVSNGDEALLRQAPGKEPTLGLQDGRFLTPARAPDYEPAFALTVHKAQGSEFDHVFVILPDRDSPLLTRELLYTAVTRARIEVTLVGRISVLAQALARSAAPGA